MVIHGGSQLGSFDVARNLGTSALLLLAAAHKSHKRWQKLDEEAQQETKQERMANAGRTVSERDVEWENVLRQLFPAVMLFQSSMEAKLKLASDHNSSIAKAIKAEGSFAKRWEAALAHVGQSTSEFDIYADKLYRGVRNPIVHLDSEKKLSNINDISFETVYTGIRYGWWAYARLVHGLGLADDNLKGSWDTICGATELEADLYPAQLPPEKA